MTGTESVDNLLDTLAEIASRAPRGLASELFDLRNKLAHAVRHESTAATTCGTHHHHYYGIQPIEPAIIQTHQTGHARSNNDNPRKRPRPRRPRKTDQMQDAEVETSQTPQSQLEIMQSSRQGENEAKEQPTSTSARPELDRDRFSSDGPPRLQLSGNAGKPSWRQRQVLRIAEVRGDNSATVEEAALPVRSGYLPPGLRGKTPGAESLPMPPPAAEEKRERWAPRLYAGPSAYRPPGSRGG